MEQVKMLRKNSGQIKLITLTIEELMPEEHFLRDLEKYVDFSFIYDKVEHLYSKTGRPSIDPVVLIKMLLIGFLYGIESERRIEKEINVNIAYKWFLGLHLMRNLPTIVPFRKPDGGNLTAPEFLKKYSMRLLGNALNPG
jgi:transposase